MKLPLFLLAYRSGVHETIGYTPSQILFGRELRLHCDPFFSHLPDTPSSPEEYLRDLQAHFEESSQFYVKSRMDSFEEKVTLFEAK